MALAGGVDLVQYPRTECECFRVNLDEIGDGLHSFRCSFNVSHIMSSSLVPHLVQC